MSDILEKMRQRRSVRAYEDRPIDDALLTEILKTGIAAATGGNLQPYSIIVERDAKRNEMLCDICGGQAFIKNAPVNLLFIIDWHKMHAYTKRQRAPLTAPRSLMHFLIALQDMVCTAQSIETAAWLSGIGSCYVGSAAHAGDELVEMYGIPKLCYPVLILSMGYPQRLDQPLLTKLSYDAMVFEGMYKDMSDEQICAFYDEKYGDKKLTLPPDAEMRRKMLADFERALKTTYSADESADIVKEADERGFIWENQRRFGLHYHAHDLYKYGKDIYEKMRAQGIEPFEAVEKA